MRRRRFTGGRRDPALGMFLDEVGNVAPLPNLASLMSYAGGSGIFVTAILQSFAQARQRWGRDGADMLWGASTTKIALGGLSGDELEAFSKLTGTWDQVVTSTQHGRHGTTHNNRRVHHLGRARTATHLRSTQLADAGRGRGATVMRYRWVDPTQMPEPRGPVPMPRVRVRRRTIGRNLRTPRDLTASRTEIEPAAGTDVPLSEWHALSPQERRREWRALVDWVEWLHDRYELGVSDRLPDCWPQHPGLIEELRALKAWREQIYTSPNPSGQAARAWHGDLRALIAAAGSHYSTGCRARTDHRTPQALQSNPDVKQRWLAADPAGGIPTHLLSPAWHASRTEGDDVIPHDQMRQHLENGTATVLDTGAGEYVRHADAWWAAAPDGWLRITDEAVAAELDSAYARLAELAQAAELQQRLNNL